MNWMKVAVVAINQRPKKHASENQRIFLEV